MSILPYKFEARADSDFDDPIQHLVIANSETLRTVKLPPLDCAIFETVNAGNSENCYADISNIEAATAGFKNFNNCGFCIGPTYAEFLAIVAYPKKWKYVTLSIAGKEVTFGDVSPLAIYVYDGIHDRDFHGDWADAKSIRIHNVPPDRLEAYLLTAILHMRETSGVIISIVGVHDFEYPNEEDTPAEGISLEEERIISIPNVIANNDVLRLYYDVTCSGPDGLYKYIQQYRIIEHFAFDEYSEQILKARSDRAISDHEFLERIRAIFTKDERGVICKYLSAIFDQAIMTSAVDLGVIDRPDRLILANAIYDRRNSLVHAKTDARTCLVTNSPLFPIPLMHEWDAIMSMIVKKAVNSWPRRTT